MTQKHTPNWNEVGPELLAALHACAVDFAGDQPRGDNPHSNAVRAVRATIAKAEGRL